MMSHRSRSSNQGFAMFLVMIYIFLAVAVVAGVSTAVMSAFRTTDNFDASRKALEAAEYGEVQAMANWSGGGETDLGLAAWREQHEQEPSDRAAASRLPAFGASGVTPVPLAAVGGAEYIATAEIVKQEDQGGVANTAPESPERLELVVVCAAGRCGNAERRLEAVYRTASAEKDTQPTQFTRIAWRELPPVH